MDAAIYLRSARDTAKERLRNLGRGISATVDWLDAMGNKAVAKRPLRCLAGLAALAVLLTSSVAGFAMLEIAPTVGPLLEERAVPSRLYSRPLELDHQRALGAGELIAYLRALGYREWPNAAAAAESLLPGWFSRLQPQELDLISFRTRRSLHPEGPPADVAVVAQFDDRSLERLVVDGAEVHSFGLEPVELARFLDSHRIEVRPLNGAELPATLARAVLAAEDDAFERHGGVSLVGIARAAWKNLRAGRVLQGASTITQQLARNRFLDHERTLERKAREALMALILERRHSKAEILSAYADLVYLGVRDGVNIVGLAAAAHTYFGKRVDDLSLSEAATLAGMIAAPGHFSPAIDQARARQRRNWVLGRMKRLGWIDGAEWLEAKAEPLAVAFSEPSPTDARYFARAVQEWVEERAGIRDLDRAGYRIDSTLDWLDQKQAEAVVEEHVESLSHRLTQGHLSQGPPDDLEAALVSLDPVSGDLLAYLGGRDYERSQFDRVRQARRQIGSLFKPVVYAAAFEQRVATPTSTVLDLPVAVSYGDQVWAPDNSDGTYRGSVSAQRALELSLNAATLRLATRVGLRRVREMASALGLPASDGPSLVLGANGASAWQVASAYSVFANGGLQQELRPVRRVFDREGQEVVVPRSRPRRVLRRSTVGALNQGLQGVLSRGTGAAARRLGVRDQVAGKTGTSNQRRDSWFAGFSPERLTVAWVGRDSFAPTPFTGAAGALPLWADFTLAVRPRSGYRAFEPLEADVELDVAPCPETAEVAARFAAEQAAQRSDDCEPPIAYESWRRRHGLMAALGALPIAERQGPPPEARVADTETEEKLDFQLREVVQLDGPFGDVVQRRVQWVGVVGG